MIRLRAGPSELVLDPARGGRVASLTIGGRELLRAAPDDEDRSVGWGCFLMAPWPGRVAGGRFEWEGQVHRLRRTREGHALHGLVYDRPWSIERTTSAEARLTCDLGSAGWPFGGRVSQGVRLQADGLRLTASVVAGDRSMPMALGWHPWFRRSGGEPHLLVDAASVLETHGRIPTGRLTAVKGRTDLRSGPLLGDRRLDHVYVDPRSPVVATWPDLELRVEFGRPIRALVVFSPPGAVCLEPETAWPDAFHALTAASGVRILRPGQTLRATMRLRWRATGAAQ